jgi:hypothetical protein
MKNGGWLDNYGTQENYNDYKVSAPKDFKGNGYSNVGRNYSPAWGGQFQMGGDVYPVNYVPQAQEGKKLNPFTYPKPDYSYSTNPFLVRDPQFGIFIGGVNPTYSTKDFSIGASLVGVGNEDFQKLPADYGIRGSYNPTDSLSINANLSKDNIGAGLSYRFQDGGSMFKKPSILQQEYIDPIYSYSERGLYPVEEKLFKERTDVAGMATEDNRVIINPYSPISKDMKDLVRTNETARLAMRNGYPRPDFELTPKQQEFYSTIQNGKPYSEDLQDIKETIAARVMTGDDSAQDYTKEQEMYADKLFDVLKKSKEYATGMKGMMKSKIGMAKAFEQDPKFDSSEESEYFSKNYKDLNSFQTGGSVPGSVGFTYARTKGIPSNGPYAKKTMASAKNGGWLDGYEKAQDGDLLDKWRADHPTVRSFINDSMNRKLQSKGKGKEVNIVQRDNTKTVTPKIGKIATAKEKEQRAIEQNKLAQQQSEQQAAKDWVQGSMEEAYKSPLMSPGYFTPEGAMIGAMQGATKLGPDLYEGNYKAAAMDALMMLPITIPAAKTLRNIKNINPEGKIFSGMNNELNNMAIQNTERYMAKRTPTTSTLSPEMEPYVSRYTKLSDEPYIPYQEDEYIKWFNNQKAKMNPSTPVQDPRSILRRSSIVDINNPEGNYTLPEIPSELHLDVNQPGFDLARTTPKVKRKLPPQWTETQLDNGLIEQTPLRKGINEEVVKKVVIPDKGEIALKTSTDAAGNPVYYFSADVSEGGLWAGKAYKHLEEFIPKGSKILENKSLSTDSFYNVMQRAKNPKRFTWVDEGQFVPLNNAGKNKVFSNSDKIVPGSTNVKFEDYNEAKKALDEFNSRITIEGMPKAKLSKIVDDFQPVKDGPWIKKTTFGIDVPNIGLIKQYKQGGIIKDDRGQWDYPGEITEINSNNITMQGVPYPVLGISDTGHTQMMYPGKDYKFKGKKVTEFPMAKNGLRQEQKGLVNLDQLTNFTNYNKPQPGGWLNKYN